MKPNYCAIVLTLLGIYYLFTDKPEHGMLLLLYGKLCFLEDKIEVK